MQCKCLGTEATGSSSPDACQLSAHKIQGPKGLVRFTVRVKSSQTANFGNHKSEKRRAGTENVAGAGGLGSRN